MSKQEFERSATLKHLFQEQFTKWKVENSAGLTELARRCGVSASYLSHVSRYGRVPGKPVLILLALNFGLENPESIFKAAELREPWPLGPGIGLGESSSISQGFVTLNVDMKGLADSMRQIVREEVKPRSVNDLTRGNPLRIGINTYQHSLINRQKEGSKSLFEELCEKLSLTLRCSFELIPTNRAKYLEQFIKDELDMFGPVSALYTEGQAIFSDPFCSIGISALVRTRPSSELPHLEIPQSVNDLLERDYKVAVLRDSGAHLYANTRLNRSNEELVLCDSIDEAVERLILTAITKPAHIFVENSHNTIMRLEQHKGELDAAFLSKDSALKMAGNTIAVRPDWPELATALNQSLGYLSRTGSLEECFAQCLDRRFLDVIRIA